jgi:hypothetical protein
MVKYRRSQRDHRRHSAQTADEKVNRDFPRPHRRFDHRLTVVTRFSRNWTAGNVNTASGDDTVLPRLLAQFFEALFEWRIGCHEKSANAKSVAMIDAIAVANAEVHADDR